MITSLSFRREKEEDNVYRLSVYGRKPNAFISMYTQSTDKIFYQALAFMKLGDSSQAKSRFNKLIDYGEKHIFDEPRIDYFAVSLPDLLIWEKDLKIQNTLHCRYLIALGNMGKGHMDEALQEMREILVKDRYHLGAWVHHRLIISELCTWTGKRPAATWM